MKIIFIAIIFNNTIILERALSGWFAQSSLYVKFSIRKTNSPKTRKTSDGNKRELPSEWIDDSYILLDSLLKGPYHKSSNLPRIRSIAVVNCACMQLSIREKKILAGVWFMCFLLRFNVFFPIQNWIRDLIKITKLILKCSRR